MSATICDLDTFSLEYIVGLLGGPWGARELRATCRAMRRVIVAPKHCTACELMYHAIYLDDFALLEIAIRKGARDWSRGAFVAGYCGNLRMAEEMRSRARRNLRYKFNIYFVDYGAIIGNCEDIVIAFTTKHRTWGVPTEVDALMWLVGYSGNMDYCKQVTENQRVPCSARELGCLLCGAAFGGHRAICERARELGARCFLDMHRSAKKGGWSEGSALALTWARDGVLNRDFGHDKFKVADVYELVAIARGASWV